MSKSLVICMLFIISEAGWTDNSETCDSLTIEFRNKLNAIVSMAQGTPESSVQQAMAIFEQGYNQCRSGQEEQGVVAIRQAIGLLAGNGQ